MTSSLLLSSPPPGYASLTAIQPMVYVVILSAVCASILVPMFFFMFFLSTPQIRRTPLFIMNVVAVVSAIVAGFIQVHRMTSSILFPNTPNNRAIQRVAPVFWLILPIFVDCILAVRLYVVYPRSLTSSALLALIFTPIIGLKILRTANATYYLVLYSQNLSRSSTIWESFVKLWFETPCMQIEWIAGLVDNCWASVWFLWRLHRDIMARGSFSDSIPTNGTLIKISRQLQNLFYLALSSFVFPCIFNILAVIICYTGTIFSNTYTYLLVISTYVQVIGVLLATIWVSKERGDHNSGLTSPTSLRSNLPFHATTVGPGSTWASEDLSSSTGHHVEGQRSIDCAIIMQISSPPTLNDYVPPKELIV
ncbi:hypothetical protein DL96DRAFT_1716468 [Flagelloscypha sp. PMI_526]|nr:hypothetical protein DL96DRAFT_1716468 [Flagelloscypha sp. PMI_526]